MDTRTRLHVAYLVHTVKRLLREPLLHFAVLGAVLFGIDAQLSGDTVEANDQQVVISEGRILSLTALFKKTWKRTPTPRELRGLVDDHILEQVLYREAMALGLDQDDTIVRRRLRQKMEFVVSDLIETTAPTTAELETWLTEHADLYAQPDRFSFRHVYLSADRRGGSLEKDAKTILADLQGKGSEADTRELGDSSLLELAYADTDTRAIVGMFGQEFADGLAKSPSSKWSGPIKSAFGLHLVLIDQRIRGSLPPLATVREQVERDLVQTRRKAASEQFYADLLKHFSIEIEWPKEMEALGKSTELPQRQG